VTTLKFDTFSTSVLSAREIVLVTVAGVEGLADGVWQATKRKDGGLNTKKAVLPAGDYSMVRWEALAALTEVPEGIQGLGVCRKEHDATIAGTAAAWQWQAINKPGAPHDCRVCYGAKALRAAAPAEFAAKRALWKSEQVTPKADTAAEAAAEVAEAEANEAPVVEEPVKVAPKPRAPRKAKAA
jgi:hypothetical protein